MAVCKKCGKELIAGASFCAFCGTAVTEKVISITVCKKCGITFGANLPSCPRCGTENSAAPKSDNKQASPKDAIKIEEQQTVEKINKIEFKMIPISGGTFNMGNADTRIVPVMLSPYLISNILITQGLYQQVVGNNPSKIKGLLNPVESVSWYDAIVFCNKLSKLHKLKPCYSIGTNTDFNEIERNSQLWMRLSCDMKADGYRLPTEAEWEFAASGGGKCLYAGSDDIEQVAWYGENSGIKTHPVGQKMPNRFGLYDMSGNVEEWCNDWYADYKQIPQNNPVGSMMGTHKIKRGGSWLHDAEQCVISARNFSLPQSRGATLGFRICQSKIN